MCVFLRACVCVRTCVYVRVCVCGGEKGKESGKSKERWGRVRDLDGILSASHFTR